MKKLLAPIVLSALCLPIVTAQEPEQEPPAPQEQEKVPPQPKSLLLGERVNADVTLYDLDGKPQRAGDLMGKITVVNFYSIQCPIQRAWDQRLAEIQTEYEKQGVVFLHINSNVTEIGAEPPKKEDEGDEDGAKPYAKVRDHLAKSKLPFRVLADHGNVVADLFQAKTTPHVYVFGRDGRLCYKGLVDDDQKNRRPDERNDYLRDTLTTLVKGEQVKPFETKEVGCSIKRVSTQKQGERRRGGRRGRRGSGGGDN